MSFEGYAAFDDPYVYKGTSVLKNKLKTRDAAVLSAFEVEMTALRAEEPLPDGRFGTAHYRAVHHHIFQDVYRWAGRYRTVRTGKDGNWFCYPEYIPREMERVFGDLRRSAFLAGRTFDDFAVGAADFLAELNAIHPFREGNGRLQPAVFLAAMVASFGSDTRPLVREISALRR
jgi:cell filamentation protein